MKVTYDISALGAGLRIDRYRTGIARVVDELGQQLALRDDVGLELSSFQSIDVYLESQEFLKQQDVFDSETMTSPNNWGGKALMAVGKYAQRYRPGLRDDRRGLSRYSSRAYTLWDRASQKLTSRLNFSGICDSGIFHSPFLPLPRYLKGKAGFRRFITVHDLIPLIHPEYFSHGEDQLARSIINSIASEDWVFTDSMSTRDDLCNYSSIEPGRIVVNHLAASDSFTPCARPKELARVRRQYGIPEGPYILSLSTLEPRKNLTRTVRSFCALVEQEKIPDLQLVLVGPPGWNYEDVFELQPQHVNLRERIIFTGFVPDSDLSPLYSGAMMFAYPSLYEGFGLPPLEAMSCGLPVITSNTSSLPEVVGDAGFQIDPLDEDALCQAMFELYNSASLRKQLAEKSIERAKKFSWAKCADRCVQSYDVALNSD